MDSKNRLLKPEEAADLLGVEPKTLQNWRTSGVDGPAYVKIGTGGRTSPVRYEPEAIAEYIRRRRVQVA